MCAKADYREGLRVMHVEVRRLMRGIAARWRRRIGQDARRPALAPGALGRVLQRVK
jgi:hypothetical protein